MHALRAHYFTRRTSALLSQVQAICNQFATWQSSIHPQERDSSTDHLTHALESSHGTSITARIEAISRLVAVETGAGTHGL